MKTKLDNILAAAALAITPVMALADAGHGVIGKAGKVDEVDRTFKISMTEMKFDPAVIEVTEGETIRFVVTNAGRAVHEFNLGNMETWRGHRGEMIKMRKAGMMTSRLIRHDKMLAAGMMHDDPNSVLLEPGDTGDVIWTFSEAGEIGFGCNVPGHLEAGMKGSITFTSKDSLGSSPVGES